MTTITSLADAKSLSIGITVIRCGCGNPGAHVGAVCPRPRRIERRGVIAFHHQSTVIDWTVNLWIKLKELYWK